MNFCKANGILVQGRGSAANSAVCYCLEITVVDPIASNLLFERFLNENRSGADGGRKSWPDIDLDLPSGDRRELVIQEMYRRYGRQGVAMTANVITLGGRSTMREIGKALHLPIDVLNRFSSLFHSGDFPHTLEISDQFESAGLAKTHPRAKACLAMFQAVHGLPRHLGHPMKLMREQLPDAWHARDVASATHGATITIAGAVICRQRPGTAKGFVFISLEDETGISNAVVSRELFEAERLVITQEPYLSITGVAQTEKGLPIVRATKVERLMNITIGAARSHDFH